MRVRWVTAWAVVLLSAAAGTVRADDEEAAKLVDAAIKAAGGEANLAKFPAATWKGKGTFYDIGRTVPFTGAWAVQPPDRARVAVTGKVRDHPFTRVLVLNGAKGCVKLDDQVEELDKESLAEEKRRLYVNWVASLAPLKDGTFKFASAGEPKRVGDRLARGVRVTREGQPEVVLYFDAESHLLLQSEATLRDTAGGAAMKQEVAYGDYRAVGGLQRPMKLTVRWDGRRVAEAVLSDYQPLEKLDDKEFAQP